MDHKLYMRSQWNADFSHAQTCTQAKNGLKCLLESKRSPAFSTLNPYLSPCLICAVLLLTLTVSLCIHFNMDMQTWTS